MKDRALRLARFGRALRAEGVATTLRDELDAAEALTLVDHGDREEVRRKPFDEEWSARALVRMERLLARLARRLASRRSRRWVPTRGRGRADVRASFRRSLRTSGELLSLARRTRAIDEPRVVFLLDTS